MMGGPPYSAARHRGGDDWHGAEFVEHAVIRWKPRRGLSHASEMSKRHVPLPADYRVETIDLKHSSILLSGW
jgi:hypothetical protein